MNFHYPLSSGTPACASAILAYGVLLTNTAQAANHPAVEAGSFNTTQALLATLGILAVAGFVVSALVMWGKKQDQIGEMTLFGMEYLFDFDRVTQGCEAARELGRAGDPGAFLVLLDVFQDESAPDPVRQAAGEALTEIGKRSSKMTDLVSKAKQAAIESDHGELIRILSEHFERGAPTYVQSAFLIGRAYLRMGHFADAKEWLKVADERNRKAALYGGRIHTLVEETNRRLFSTGDQRFAAGDYQAARERYAAASHSLSHRESTRYSAFLRLACAYSMLGDFRDATQSLIQAKQQGLVSTEAEALQQKLERLLDRQQPPTIEEYRRLALQIRTQVETIMAGLTT